MCGIAGVFNFDGRKAETALLTQMAARMQHRGPDDEGIYTDGPLGFAFRRLAIIDLSQLGHQPMLNHERTHCIVFNGEIYNYKELRDQLVSQGHRFNSRTDTEVILQGFCQEGPDFVKKLNGMFSFAIWDIKEKKLQIFRDRLGVKPLYYYCDDHRFIFASEIKPIFDGGVAAELNHEAVSSYFSLRYVPGDKTLFKNIKKLMPGDFLTLKTSQRRPEKHTYWSLLDQNTLSSQSESEAVKNFAGLLDNSVKGSLVGDVPMGAFLSGGIDSAAIVSLMKKNQQHVETFTFGVGGDIDETARAAWIAEKLEVSNESIRLKSDDFKFYKKALWHLEEPIGDSIIVPTFILAQRAAKKVKVVLLGEGADEIMGGYVHQLALTYGQKIKGALPLGLQSAIAYGLQHFSPAVLGKFFPYPATLGKSGVGRLAGYFNSKNTEGGSYLDLVGLFSESEKALLFNRDYGENFIAPYSPARTFDHFFEKASNPVFQNKLLQLDLRFWSADYGLLRMDKLTMAHSLEARVPYLDHRLVELCLSLPASYKTKLFKQKILMRKALQLRQTLPREIVKAPKKAFYLPVEKCFDSKFEDFVQGTLSDSAVLKRGLFNAKFVSALRDKKDRELIENKQLMALLNFDLWAQMYLDGHWQQAPA